MLLPLYFARGMLFVHLSEYEEAQKDFDQAYKLDPKTSLTAAAQSLTAVQQNDFATALAGISEKLKTRPDDPILLYMQADVLASKIRSPGRPNLPTAIGFGQASSLSKSCPRPRPQVLAKLYMAADRYQEAAAECRKALR